LDSRVVGTVVAGVDLDAAREDVGIYQSAEFGGEAEERGGVVVSDGAGLVSIALNDVVVCLHESAILFLTLDRVDWDAT
jgi:hypothetical protein